MMSGSNRTPTSNGHWTSGNTLPWILGVTLGFILGLILLIVVPHTLGHAAAPAADAATPAAAGSEAAAGTEAAAGEAKTDTAATDTTAPAAGGAAGGAGNADSGKTFFASNCAGCHGANAEGGVGPKLNEAAAWTLEQFGAAVHEGKAPDKTLAAMMPHFSKDQVSDAQLSDVHTFLQQTFGVKSDAAPASPAGAAAGAAAATGQVDGKDVSASSNTTETKTTATTADAGAAGDADAGKAKFTATCAGCHGANAEGGVGPALKVAHDWTLEQFTAAVREGKTPEKTLGAVMPHFTPDQLTDAELNNVYAFVKTVN